VTFKKFTLNMPNNVGFNKTALKPTLFNSVGFSKLTLFFFKVVLVC
jgi:hypothetical protein